MPSIDYIAEEYVERAARIRSNPAHGLGLPRTRRRDYVFLTHEHLRDLAAEAEPSRVFVLLLGHTGLRWGEATALRVSDVDLARRRIDVRRAFSDVGGHVVLGWVCHLLYRRSGVDSCVHD